METWKKNLYVIWVAQFLAMVGMSMVVPFLPFYIRDLGVTDQRELEKWSGLIFAGPFVLSFFLTPVWGALGDKYGKKKMVVRAIIGLALSQFLIGISGNVYELLIFRLVQGAASGFIASSLALVSSGSPEEKSGYSIGLLQTSISSGTILGPMLGGFFSDMTSHRAVFFITASLCLVSAVFTIFFVTEPEKQIHHKNVPSVADNIKYSFSNFTLSRALISIAVVQMSIAVTQPIFALFIESMTENKQYLSTIAGSLFGITGVATAISSPWWGKRNDKKSLNKNLFFAMSGASAALILHVVISGAVFLFPVRLLLGFCIGGIIPAFYTLINKNVSPERKSGVMGIASSFTILGNMLGPLFCSLLTYFMDIRYVFLIAGIMLLINTAFIKMKKLNPEKAGNI
ncbi:MAG: MFS transporter [Ignavibacteriae bacterium]|nr:MFS transporter [Ignavibacteriota bacterium]